MVSISGEKVVLEIMTWRCNNDFHFSLKGKKAVQNTICHPGVKDSDLNKSSQRSRIVFMHQFEI